MLKELGIDKVYVVHALNGYEFHEKHMKNVLSENNIEFEFVSDGDPSFFDKIGLENYFKQEFIDNTAKGSISLTLNHIFCLRKIVESNARNAIIFEDDIFLHPQFHKRLKNVMLEAKGLNPSFFLSLENTTLKFPSYWQKKKGKCLYHAKKGRCTGAYIVDNACAKAILKDLEKEKCDLICDIWYDKLSAKGVFKIYWAFPTLAEQGSHNGLLSSIISMNRKSLGRRINWLFQKSYKLCVRRFFNHKYIIEN